MTEEFLGRLKSRMSSESFEHLKQLQNKKLYHFICDFSDLCEPASIRVCDDSSEDSAYIKQRSLETGEERLSSKPGQTFHFDSYFDQARDKANTKYLLKPGMTVGPDIGHADQKTGTEEVRQILKGSMKGREMLVKFYCLGPLDSVFSLPCVQITDSYYVIHSESILYRPGFQTFRAIGDSENFFRFVHSAGRMENAVCVDIDKRRVFIDLADNIVYSTNTQYAGNSVGLKKLAMRLAIHQASKEGWLTEHMFIMGVKGVRDPNRITYFTGAFPSACGKTSTSMLSGETIVGDDIAYLRVINGKLHAANVEAGIFGIISDINSKDDPEIFNALIHSEEVIFNNVLITEGNEPYWVGKDGSVPVKGVNHGGLWAPGTKGPDGKEVTASHKNARFTISLNHLANLDKRSEDPQGVPVGGYIYGGRDSDTTVPVEEAFDFVHGITTKGATIESESTAATLGKEGVRAFDLMSNKDFLSIPFGVYIAHNLAIAKQLQTLPKIFSVNYFLRGSDGKYLNGKLDKHVWLKWMEQRVNEEVGALKTPTGYIPQYENLRELFKLVLKKDYSLESYRQQFRIRIPEHLAKLDRIESIYREKVKDTPEILFHQLEAQRVRLAAAQEEFGDTLFPEQLEPAGAAS